MAEHIGGFLITNFKLNHRSLAPWRVLGIDECGEALPQKTARYARTFLGTPFSRRRSQAHATVPIHSYCVLMAPIVVEYLRIYAII